VSAAIIDLADRCPYQTWIDNDRRLRDLLGRLEELGAAALDAGRRWQCESASANHRTRADQLITPWTQPAFPGGRRRQ
jgi:hypothetical protein